MSDGQLEIENQKSKIEDKKIVVSVKLYASLRRYRPEVAQGRAFACDLPGGATIGHLILEALRLPSEEVAIILVNGIQRNREWAPVDGDTVALWPPIAGG